MRTYKIAALLVAASAMAAARSNADELDADTIVSRSLRAFYYAGSDMRSHISMRLVSDGGATRQREFSMLRRNLEGGRQQFYTFFEAPAGVRGMGFYRPRVVL